MKDRCPKCKTKYAQYGSNKKTEHHVIPRKLWSKSDLPTSVKQVLDSFTQDICRQCHDDLNKVLEKIEAELLYREHQGIYISALITFLGGNHALPALPLPLDRSRDGP